MSQDMQNALESRLIAVRQRFLDLLDERLDHLEVLRDDIEGAETRQNALNEIRFVVHKIAGTAGTLGFSDIGNRAAEVEETIETCLCEPSEQTDAWQGVAKKLDDFLEIAAQLTLAQSKRIVQPA